MVRELQSVSVQRGQSRTMILSREYHDGTYVKPSEVPMQGNYLFVKNDKSLGIFNVEKDVEIPVLEYEGVVGYNSETPENYILVSKGTKLYKYKLQGNNITISKEDHRV